MQGDAFGDKVARGEANALLGQHITDYNNLLQNLAGVEYGTERWYHLWEKKNRQEQLIRLHRLEGKLRGWVKTCFEGTHIPILEGKRIMLYPRP